MSFICHFLQIINTENKKSKHFSLLIEFIFYCFSNIRSSPSVNVLFSKSKVNSSVSPESE